MTSKQTLKQRNLQTTFATVDLSDNAPQDNVRVDKPMFNKSQNINFNLKFVMDQKSKATKKERSENKRFEFSPPVQTKPDLQKPAWERLLERSFDPRSIMLIQKQQKQRLQKQSSTPSMKECLSQTITNSVQKSIKGKVEKKSQKQNQKLNQNKSQAIFIDESGVLNSRNPQQANESNTWSKAQLYQTDKEFRSPKLKPTWQALMDKTQDELVKKSTANSSQRRTIEQFLSGRTINPGKYASHADYMLIQSENKREKSIKRVQDNNGQASITGCARRQALHQFETEFKLAYSKEEIAAKEDYYYQQDQQGLPMTRRKSNRGCQLNSDMIPNETALTYLGGSKINCMLTDRGNVADGSYCERPKSLTRELKIQRDYNSQVSCLSPEPSISNLRTHGQKRKTLFDNQQSGKKSAMNYYEEPDLTKPPQSSAVSQILQKVLNYDLERHQMKQTQKKHIEPTYTKQSDYSMIGGSKSFRRKTSVAQIGEADSDYSRARSASKKRPEGAKDMFVSQIKVLS